MSAIFANGSLTEAEPIPAQRAAGTALARLRFQDGVAALAQGDRAAAALAFGAAMRLDPMQADAACNLAVLCLDEGYLAEAEALCRAALAVAPTHVAAATNLGNALHRQGRHQAAGETYAAVLRCAPHAADALIGLGLSLQARGAMEAAIAALRQATEVTPACPIAHNNLAHALLAAGNFAEGWAEFEWRAASPARRVLRLPGRQWRGEPLYGRRLLIQAEGGYGDMIQFARYVPLVMQRGGQVVMSVYKPLLRLFAGLPGVDLVETGAKLPPYDLHCPLLSLPRIFGTAVDNIPPPLPLRSEHARIAAWRARIAPAGRRIVGLVWAGAPRPGQKAQMEMDRRRSLPLAALAPLAELPGIALVSLQTDAGPGLPMFDAMAEMADFADTAGLAGACDLVISVDTAMAHLAASLDRPVWLLDRYDGCWRWLKARDTSPWYPALRLFRQAAPGDWGGVVARVCAELIADAA